jgi:hypothetical protein
MTLKNDLKGAQGHAGDTHWMVTFGDLLTLLLCFFCAVITLNANNIKDLNTSLNTSQRPRGDGTVIAANTQRQWFYFSEVPSSVEIKGALLKHQQEHPTLKNAEIADIYVEVCSGSVGEPNQDGWSQSIERALAIKRQLLDDFGLADGRIALRSLGRLCSEISGSPKTEEAKIGLGIGFQGRF